MPLKFSNLRGMAHVILTKLKKGDKAIVIGVDSGAGILQRLSCMGIVPGKLIQKMSTLRLGGPVILLVDRAQLAIGYGMAEKVVVEKIEDGKA